MKPDKQGLLITISKLGSFWGTDLVHKASCISVCELWIVQEALPRHNKVKNQSPRLNSLPPCACVCLSAHIDINVGKLHTKQRGEGEGSEKSSLPGNTSCILLYQQTASIKTTKPIGLQHTWALRNLATWYYMYRCRALLFGWWRWIFLTITSEMSSDIAHLLMSLLCF